MKLFMASACLAGVACRYNGEAKTDAAIRAMFERGEVTLFCPELLGGMEIPRPAMILDGGDGGAVLDGAARVLTRDGGIDRTGAMLEGARRSLAIALAVRPETIFLKARSPSCGCGAGGAEGVTAALLRRGGFILDSIE